MINKPNNTDGTNIHSMVNSLGGNHREVDTGVPKLKEAPKRGTLIAAYHRKQRSAILKRRLKKKYRMLLRNLKRLERLEPSDELERNGLKSYFLELHSEETELEELGVKTTKTLYGMHKEYQVMLAEKLQLNESI